MFSRTLLLLAACWLVACSPSPSPRSSSAAPAHWTVSVDRPAADGLPDYHLSVDGNGRVALRYSKGLEELVYTLDKERLAAIEGAVQGISDWTPAQAQAEGRLLRETAEGKTDTALSAHPELGGLLGGLVARPFAQDQRELWLGGRLTKGVEVGSLELHTADENELTDDQRWNLEPRPDMFAPGDIVVIAGKRAEHQAGISMRGNTYSVTSLCRWPQALAPAATPEPAQATPKPQAKTKTKTR